jgi:hypothetical protein
MRSSSAWSTASRIPFTVAAKNAFGYGPESTHPATATPMGPPQVSDER